MTQVKSFTFNPFSENTFILFDDVSRDAIVVDPGCYTTNEQKQLKKFIADNQLTVKRLINTHCHLDHVFGNRFVEETYGVELEAHRAELPVLARAHIAGGMYGTPMPEQVPFSIFIEDNDAIQLGNATFKAILAPGHSPGIITINGNYLQSAGSALNIELQGTNAATPEFDQLAVIGTVTLAGTLNVSLLTPFVLSPGDSFEFIHNDGSDVVSGRFDGLPDGYIFQFGSLYMRIDYARSEERRVGKECA